METTQLWRNEYKHRTPADVPAAAPVAVLNTQICEQPLHLLNIWLTRFQTPTHINAFTAVLQQAIAMPASTEDADELHRYLDDPLEPTEDPLA